MDFGAIEFSSLGRGVVRRLARPVLAGGGLAVVRGDSGAVVPFDLGVVSRPAPLGSSIGADPPRGSPGTLGCVLRDKSGWPYVLSCWHVLCRGKSTGARHPAARDSVEGVRLGPVVAFVRPVLGGAVRNVTDAAVCRLDDPAAVAAWTPAGGYGAPADDPIAPQVGAVAAKWGRSTRATDGVVQSVDAIVTVNYGAGVAAFGGIVVVRKPDGVFCKPGDSGALVVDAATRRPIGILFGQAARGEFGLVAPIGATLEALAAAGMPGLRIEGTQ